ncbi:Hypothetical predicted protein, partial [Paramuricea clavata]
MDDLIQKYDLPAVSKSSLELKEQKNLLRSPLDTITGRNNNNIPKQKTKKISPKNAKDPSQRTLNFFVQTPNANTTTKDHTTPTKDKSSEKLKGSPVIAELKICLTPKSKVKEVVAKSSENSKADSVRNEDGSKTEGKAARSLFNVEQDVAEVIDKADEVAKSEITIQDDEEDFVPKKPSVIPDKENKKCHEDAKTSAGKKITEKKIETNLNEKENGHSSKLDNVDNVKKISSKKADEVEKCQITIQDDEEDFVPKKPSVKPDKENKKCHEDTKLTSAGQKNTEKNTETNLKENENGHSNKLDDVDEVNKINNTKADEVEKSQITIQDDAEDFVPSVKPDKEMKKSHEDAETSAGKKITEKNIETNLKENENVHANKLGDVDKVKINNTTKHDVVMLDDDFSEKEKKIVKNNALKKQKTLSQMFKFNTSKSSSKIKTNVPRKQPNKENKLGVLDEKTGTERESVVETVGLKKELGKELPSLKTGFEPVRLPLPSPKAVSAVPEQLRRYYGDILMITEFIHFYGNFLSQDGDLKCSPDDLVSGLMNEGPKNEIFVRILIGFLQVLLKDLLRQDSSKEFSDLGVGLLDMRVSESTVGELTRLYLQHCQNGDHSTKKTNKVLTRRKLSWNLMELNKKDIVNLTAVQKLELLTYLLDQIFISEVFYSHQQELEENRRQTWVKKIDVDTEIRELIQEQKKLEEAKNPQKEIDKFLEKCDGTNGEKAVDKGPTDSEQARDGMSGTENIAQEKNMESTENNIKKDDTTSSNLTTRQELAAKSKIEKEKFDEMRRLDEKLYQKKQKVERFK